MLIQLEENRLLIKISVVCLTKIRQYYALRHVWNSDSAEKSALSSGKIDP